MTDYHRYLGNWVSPHAHVTETDGFRPGAISDAIDWASRRKAEKARSEEEAEQDALDLLEFHEGDDAPDSRIGSGSPDEPESD